MAGRVKEAQVSQGKTLKKSPADLGYRMPAEWGAHFATWLAFPHHRTDFPGKLSAVAHTFAEMARLITLGERVRLLVRDEREAERAQKIFSRAGVPLERVDVIVLDTNRSWLRDSMPLWVNRGKRGGDKKKRSDRLAVKFRFNGWARYRDHELDEAAGQFVAQHYGSKFKFPVLSNGERIVLEGGSVDVDDVGTLLTTEECLIHSKLARFSGGRADAESALREHLGVEKILWLPQGIVGDDTSGHVDDFARFAPHQRVLICQESRKRDANYRALLAARRALEGVSNAKGKKLEIVDLPMPQAVVYDGERLPASYANFYVCNAAVLVPVFNDPQDKEALSIIEQCFPDRPTIGIYARDLVVGLGTLHCSTMQEPL